jgi:hypothetical protein
MGEDMFEYILVGYGVFVTIRMVQLYNRWQNAMQANAELEARLIITSLSPKRGRPRKDDKLN